MSNIRIGRQQYIMSEYRFAAMQLLNGVEYPTVLVKRQRKVVRLRGKIRRIRRGRQDLALSQTDWSSMIPEQNDA